MSYLRVDEPSRGINVSDVVAKLMVARIVPIAGFAPKHQLFFSSLNAFGTSSDAPTRNTISNKSITTTLGVSNPYFEPELFGSEA